MTEYVGDETCAAQFPHRNSVVSTVNYVRTQPHVLREIEATNFEASSRISNDGGGITEK